MTHKLLKFGEKVLMEALPPAVYCRVSAALRPLINPERRGGPRSTIKWLGDSILIRWEDGTEFHFAHPNRHHRYVWPEGVRHIFKEMMEKYQDGAARIHAGDIIIEAGANVGEFTCAAAQVAGQIYSFEPDPLPFTSLVRNTITLPNVAVEQAGLGAADGEMTFYLSPSDADSSVVPPTQWTNVTTIAVKRIDSFIAERQLERVDFLKIEAEGFEPEILEGCGAALGTVRAVAVDCSPERGGESPFEACEALLRRFGLRTWRRELPERVPMLFAVRDR